MLDTNNFYSAAYTHIRTTYTYTVNVDEVILWHENTLEAKEEQEVNDQSKKWSLHG